MGIAFKPLTDDLRDAPALDIAARLVQRGATVRLHDPVALERARNERGECGFHFCDTVEQTAAGADALVLVTDWPEYREVDWEAVGTGMRNRFLLDGRNFLEAARLEKSGFRYSAMGR